MENFKQLERELEQGLLNAEINEGDATQISPIIRPDFISDSVLGFILGYKNKFIVGILGKELGEPPLKLLTDLYKVSDEERKLYKIALQNFVRENFPDWEDKISKITNGELVALAILEIGRLHEAKILIRAAADRDSKDKVKEAA